MLLARMMLGVLGSMLLLVLLLKMVKLLRMRRLRDDGKGELIVLLNRTERTVLIRRHRRSYRRL